MKDDSVNEAPDRVWIDTSEQMQRLSAQGCDWFVGTSPHEHFTEYVRAEAYNALLVERDDAIKAFTAYLSEAHYTTCACKHCVKAREMLALVDKGKV